MAIQRKCMHLALLPKIRRRHVTYIYRASFSCQFDLDEELVVTHIPCHHVTIEHNTQLGKTMSSHLCIRMKETFPHQKFELVSDLWMVMKHLFKTVDIISHLIEKHEGVYICFEIKENC